LRRPTRLLLRTLAWLAFLGLLAAFVVWLALRASLPQVDGRAALAGLSAPVHIERDALGVPVVRGETRVDVARATGFVHAQDRFFQMDLTRRAAAGELAGLLGPGLLETDRRLRVHRFRARAAAALAGAPPAERELVEAYAAGVNAGLEGLGARPFEYLLLRSEPRPWQPEDVLLTALAMWIDLQGSGAWHEQQTDRLAVALPVPLFRLVTDAASAWDAPLDGSPAPGPTAIPGPEVYDLRRLDRGMFEQAASAEENALRLTGLPEVPSPMVGSNNWALAGARTASGRALVANDMHLGLRVPNTWYRLRLVVDDEGVDVTGVSLPGTPLVVAGSNGRIAWGFTNSYGDYQDQVVIEPAEGGPGRYRAPGGPQEFEVHEERIEVDGGAPETLRVQETVWGPVVGADARGRPVALAWTAHRVEAVNLRLLALERAGSLDAAVDVLASAGIPAQNAIIGDAEGRIGWVIAGRIPERRGFDPSLPASWAEPGTGWIGWLDRDRHPHLVDPLADAAWTANARVVGGEMLPLIGDGGYAHGVRAWQIRDHLMTMRDARPEDFLAIHLDDRARYLEQWQRLLVAVLEAGGAVESGALGLVRGWSGRAAPGDAGYHIVREFERLVSARAFDMLTAEARIRWPAFRWRVPARFTDVAWRLVQDRPAHLLDPRYDDWDTWLADAAAAALRSAEHGCGRHGACGWGKTNTARIRHPLSDALPVLGPFLDMPATEMPGDWSVPRVQAPRFGASERFAVEPGLERDGYFHMPGGQSGHPLSPWYRAGHDAWVRGEPTPFLPGPAEHVLLLAPH